MVLRDQHLQPLRVGERILVLRRQGTGLRATFLNLSADFPVYPVSARTGEGVPELRSHVGLG